MGTRTRATAPRRVLAQLTPMASNMYVAKRGKMAPKRERKKVFAAMAEAALWEKRGLVLVRGEKKTGGGGVWIGTKKGAGLSGGLTT